jgi:ribonuclease HI
MDHVLRRVVDENRSRCGIALHLALGVHMRYVIRLHFATSNNIAKYETLVNSLRIAIELGIRHLDVYGDS